MIKKKRYILLIFLILIVLIFVLISDYYKKKDNTQIANPAAVYCKENNYQYEIRTNESGQHGVCIINESTECEEWAFYRGECGK